MRILFVEDADQLRKHVTRALKASGYAVDQASDGEEGLWLAETHDYDTLILDIMLPKLNGVDILKTLRAQGNLTPVLFLTAKDTLNDRVQGLRSGADDYLVKPFEIEELLARVEALCRRSYQKPTSILSIDDLKLDSAKKLVTRSGTTLELPAREFALLEYLLLREGQVVSNKDIECHIYDDLVSPMSNVVQSAISNLRKHLAVTTLSKPLIHTRRGHGYILEVR